MQWAKAKTIMIWLFLIVDIILLTVLAVNKIKNKDSNEQLIGVLKQNNVNIREELLNHNSEKIFAYEFLAPNLTDEIAGEFLKNPVKKDNNFYESKDKTARLKMDSGYIEYENKNPDFSGFGGVNENNITHKLGHYLKILGINNYVKPALISKENEDIIVSYSYFFNDIELYSAELNFVVSQKGIKKISGNINIPNKESGYDFTLSGIETVLLNFIQNNTFLNEETIVSINEGYYLINYQNLLIAQAIPVYRIKTTNKTYIYDARDGIDASKRQLLKK